MMALERNMLRFSFQDGRVGEVCPVEADTVASVNFKRGVLSAFQNSMDQHEEDESQKEVDVTGSCPTTYTIAQKDSQSTQISKEKDLLGCTDRHNFKSSVRSTLFRIPDTIQSLPLLKGSHKCSHTVSRQGLIQAANCEESLVFRPFSNKEAGAHTKTIQKMSFVSSTSSSVRGGPVSTKTSLLYEHGTKSARDDLTLWSAKEKLNELCRLTVQEISAQTAGLFTNLVYLMRGLDSQEIMDIAERVQRDNICQDNREKARKFLMDALPMIGTAASVDVMVDMLLKGEVEGVEKEAWIASFNFIHEPNLQLIANLRRIVLSRELRNYALLPVTSVVNNYCRKDPNCATKQQVQDILNLLEDILGRNCNGEDKTLLLLALRATANLGHSDQIVTTLGRCLQSRDKPMVVRVTAAQAFKAVSCSAQRQAVINTFMNRDEDAELRINAYLSVMACPSEVILSEVKKALENESVNQVGSFVWTHLQNLRSSSAPYKQALRDILEDEALRKEFNMDRRKFSRNYELSFFSDRFGMGAGVESNVIFSSKSFLPRSLMLNLTVDMLGHSVNLMEVGGRMEGLELLIKRYMGPGGMFENKDKKASRCVRKEKMDNMKSRFAVEEDEMSASFYLAMFGNELTYQYLNERDLTNLKDKLNVKNILASLARGDDISFTKSSLFLDSTMTVPTVAGMALHLSVNGSATVELVARGKMDFRHLKQKRMQAMLDVKPSAAVELSGLMSLQSGASTAGLKMVSTLHTSTALSGSIDLINGQVLTMDFDTPKEKMEIIDFKSELFVVHNELLKKHIPKPEEQMVKNACPLLKMTALPDMGYELCGHVAFVKPASRASSPYFPFTGPTSLSLVLLKKDAPKGFKLVGKHIRNADTAVGQLSFDAPNSKGDRAINLGYFLDGKAKSAELEFNSPWKKIIGKGSYDIDPKSLMFSATVRSDGKEYQLNLDVDIEKSNKKTVYRPTFKLSRPEDSQLLRTTPVKFSLDGVVSFDRQFEEMETEVNINSGLKPDPIKLTAKYMNKGRQKSISGSATLNKNKVYSGTAQLVGNVAGEKTMTGKFEPTILISAAGWRVFLLSGKLEFKEDKILKGNVNVDMDRTMRKPIALSWVFSKQNRKTTSRIRVSASMKSIFANGKSRGSFTVPADVSKLGQKGNLLLGKLTTDYTIPSLTKNKVLLSTRVLDRSTKSLKKYRVNFNLDNKKNPKQNVVASGDFEHKETYTKALMTMGHGPKSKVKDNKLGVTLTHRLSSKMALIQYSVKFLYPKHNLEYQAEGKHEHHMGQRFWFETYSSTIFAKGKSIELRVNGKDNSKKGTLNAVGSMELNYPSFQVQNLNIEGRSYKIKTSIEKNSKKEFIHTVSLQTKESGKHSLVTKYKKLPNNGFNVDSEMKVQGPRPITLHLGAKNEKKITSLEVDVKYDESQYYRFETINERRTEKYYITNVDVTTPTRQVKVKVEGGLAASNEFVLQCTTQWDAKKNPSAATTLQITYAYDNANTGGRNQLEIEVSTPWDDHKIYKYTRLVHYRQSHVQDKMLLIIGKEENKYAYSVAIVMPSPKETLKVDLSLDTPFEQMKQVSFLLGHKFGGSRLLTHVEGKLNDHFLSVKLQFKHSGNAVSQKIQTLMEVKSSVQNLRKMKLSFQHSDNGSNLSTDLEMQINNKHIGAHLDSRYTRIHYQLQLQSKLKITGSKMNPINIKLDHGNTLTHFNTTLLLEWKRGQNCKLILGGKSSSIEKDHALDFEFIGPWSQLSSIEGKYRFKTQLGVVTYESFTKINKDVQKVYHDVWTYSDKQFELTSQRGDQQMHLIAKYAKYPYTLYSKNSWTNQEQPWRQEEILLEGSVDENTKGGWSVSAKLTTPFEHARNIDLQANIEKGKLSEWEMNTLISLDIRKQITAAFLLDVESVNKMSAKINTPFKEMREFNFGFEYMKTQHNIESKAFIEIQPIFNKVDIEQSLKLKMPKPEGRIYLHLPDTEFKSIEITGESTINRKRMITKVNVKYQSEKEITLYLKTHFDPQKFTEKSKVHFSLTTPFDAFPSMSVILSLDKTKDNWIGIFDLKTSEKTMLNLKMVNSNDKTSYDISVESSVFETVAVGLQYDWGSVKRINMSLNAPSIGHNSLGFIHNSESWTNFQNKIFFDINGYELDLDAGIEHNEDHTKITMAYVLPGSNYSYIKASAHRVGSSFNDFDIGGFLQLGKLSRPFNASVQFSNTPNKYAIGTTFETPYTKALSYLLKTEMDVGQYKSVIYAKYGKKFFFDFMASQKRTEKSLDYRVESTFKLNEHVTHTMTDLKLKAVKTGEELEFEHIFNDHWIKSNVIRMTIPEGKGDKHTLEVDIETSFKDFSEIGLQAQVDSEGNKHVGNVVLKYKDDQEAILHFDLSRAGRHRTVLNAVLSLMVDGYKENTLTYTQVIKKNMVKAESELVTGKGELLKGKLVFLENKDLSLNVDGPIEVFESLTVSAKWDEDAMRVSGKSSLKLALNPNPAKLNFDVQVNNIEPLLVNIQLESPYKHLRGLDVSVEHTGKQWNDFSTHYVLKSMELGTVNGDIGWKFYSVNNVQGEISVVSTIQEGKEIKLALKTEQASAKSPLTTHATIGWAKNKVLVFDHTWSLTEGKRKTRLSSEFILSTPFETLKNSHVKLIHTHESGTISETLNVQYNGEEYIDADLDIQYFETRVSGVLEVNRPRPMTYSFAASTSEHQQQCSLQLNWDKRDRDSQLQISTIFKDKTEVAGIERGFELVVTHPVRTMGVDYKYLRGRDNFLASGSLTWHKDQGKKISYAFGWSRQLSKTQAYDIFTMIGVPHRSVEMKYSVANSHKAWTTKSTLLWDAENDRDKKVEVSTEVKANDKQKEVTLNLNLPSIDREMNIDVVSKKASDEVLHDIKMDISYSDNPLKTITITNKLTNPLVAFNKAYNYTAEISFEHPITDVNVQSVSHIGSANGLKSTGVSVNYVTASGTTKNVQMLASIDHTKNFMEVLVSTPMKSVRVEGEQDRSIKQMRTTVRSFEDGKPALKASAVVDNFRRTLALEFNYDQDDADKMVSLNGRMVNESAFQLDMVSYRNRYDYTTETMMTVLLNSSSVLHTHLKWRPQLFSEIQNYVGTRVTEFSYNSNNVFTQAVGSLGAEVKAKYVLISQELRSELDDVFRLLKTEMEQLSIQLEALRVQLRRSYQRNDLHLRDLGQQAQAAFEEILRQISEKITKFHMYYQMLSGASNAWMEDMRNYPIAQKYQETIGKLMMTLQTVRASLEQALNSLVIEAERFSTISYRHYLQISRDIDRKLNSYAQDMHQLPLYRKMVAQREELARLGKNIIPNWAHALDKMYLQGQEMLSAQFHDMMARPEFRSLHSIASEVHQQIMYYSKEAGFDGALERLVDLSKNLLLMELMKIKNTITDINKSRLIQYDPRKGELQFELYLPVTMKSLVSKPEIRIETYLKKIKSWSKNVLPAGEKLSSMWETYSDFMPPSLEAQIMPPFKGSAYLIGSQSILTFDQQPLTFKSQCSHVLARDLLKDSFSVVVNYHRHSNRDGVRSLCMTFDDSVHLEVASDYTLEVNGKDVEMPYLTERVQVYREGEVIRVKYAGGVEVMCNPRMQLYKVTIEGWFHGQVDGLMGTYDNEPGNDILTEKKSSDLEVGRRSCRTGNIAESHNPSLDINNLCTRQFMDPASTFKHCFRQVNPESFLKMCHVYMGSMSAEEALHLVTEQYRAVCQGKGVYIGANSEFSTCGKEDRIVIDHRHHKYQSADVVFVLEDTACNQWAQTSLVAMVTEINKALETAGMKDNRFGLQGYGGESNYDTYTVRTINGQMFGDASLFMRAVETLRLKESTGSVNIKTAMQEAMQYPFRTGVAKVLVIAPCSACEVGFLDRNFDHDLYEKGFNVHVLQQQEYLYENSESVANRYKIFGIDNSKTFTNHVSDSSVTPYIVQGSIHDYCNRMAQTLNGSVFDTTHLGKSSSTERQFIKSFASRVGSDTKLPACQRCECNGKTGQMECRLCSMNYSSYLSNTVVLPS